MPLILFFTTPWANDSATNFAVIFSACSATDSEVRTCRCKKNQEAKRIKRQSTIFTHKCRSFEASVHDKIQCKHLQSFVFSLSDSVENSNNSINSAISKAMNHRYLVTTSSMRSSAGPHHPNGHRASRSTNSTTCIDFGGNASQKTLYSRISGQQEQLSAASERHDRSPSNSDSLLKKSDSDQSWSFEFEGMAVRY